MGAFDSLRNRNKKPVRTLGGGAANLSMSRRDFDYEAISPTGQRQKGRMQANSTMAVSNALQADGWIPISVVEAKQAGLNVDLAAKFSGQTKVKLTVPQLAEFFRQTSELLRAGVPITKVMAAIGEEASPKMQEICQEIGDRLTAGQPLSEALLAFPDAFDDVTRAYVSAGEMSGTLPESMARLARMLEKRNEMRLKIKGVTAYPKMVGAAIVVIVTAILLFLVPRYQEIYAQFGSDLPLPTMILVGVSENILPVSVDFTLPLPFFLTDADVGLVGIVGRILFAIGFIMGTDALRARSGKEPKLIRTVLKYVFVVSVTLFAGGYEVNPISLVIWTVGIGAFVGVRMFLTARSDNPQVVEMVDTIRFKMPVFGKIIRKNVQFQWSSTMAGTLGTGVPQLRAINLAGMTSGSNWVQLASKDIEEQVRAGKTLSEALSKFPKLFAPSVRAMISTGELTGDLPTMFENVAKTTDAEIEALVAGLSAKVEVMLLVVMAAVVGSLLVALYLPIIQLATTVSGTGA